MVYLEVIIKFKLNLNFMKKYSVREFRANLSRIFEELPVEVVNSKTDEVIAVIDNPVNFRQREAQRKYDEVKSEVKKPKKDDLPDKVPEDFPEDFEEERVIIGLDGEGRKKVTRNDTDFGVCRSPKCSRTDQLSPGVYKEWSEWLGEMTEKELMMCTKCLKKY